MDGQNKYTTTAGLPLCDEDRSVLVTPPGGHGRKQRLHDHVRHQRTLNLFMTVVNPGDNVLLPEPYFPLYGPDATLVGGESKYYPCLFENEFIPQIEDLEALVDEKTVAILYNFPSNPTGGTLNEAQRDALLAFAKKHDLWIISDEVYDRIVFEETCSSGDRVREVDDRESVSKTFAMTGWRIGYIISANLGR